MLEVVDGLPEERHAEQAALIVFKQQPEGSKRQHTSAYTQKSPPPTLHLVTPALCSVAAGRRMPKESLIIRLYSLKVNCFSHITSTGCPLFSSLVFYRSSVKKSCCDPWQLPSICRGNQRKRGDIIFWGKKKSSLQSTRVQWFTMIFSYCMQWFNTVVLKHWICQFILFELF